MCIIPDGQTLTPISNSQIRTPTHARVLVPHGVSVVLQVLVVDAHDEDCVGSRMGDMETPRGPYIYMSEAPWHTTKSESKTVGHLTR